MRFESRNRFAFREGDYPQESTTVALRDRRTRFGLFLSSTICDTLGIARKRQVVAELVTIPESEAKNAGVARCSESKQAGAEGGTSNDLDFDKFSCELFRLSGKTNSPDAQPENLMLLLWHCPFCGQETALADLNLITLFEWYLLLTFLFSLAIRYELYRSYVKLFWSMPGKWPAMYDVIKKHSTSFLNWTMTIPVGIMLAIYLIHMISYRFIWTDAEISPVDLFDSWLVWLPVLVLLFAMFYNDFRGLFQIEPVNFTDLETHLRHGEFALQSKVSKWVKRLSFNKVNPKKIVESRVAETIQWIRSAFLLQLRYQSFHTVVRIAFGFLLWTSWARLKMELSLSTYLIALAVLIGLIAFAYRWTRARAEETERSEDLPEGDLAEEVSQRHD